MSVGSDSAAGDLRGRLALITGAGSGIGRAVALGLAKAGADLVLMSERDNLDTVAKEAACLGSSAVRIRVDLTDPRARRKEIDRVTEQYDVNILVNNSGAIRRAPAEDFADEDWYDVVELNLHAAFELTRAVGAGMLKRGYGKIVNIASVLSFQGGLYVPSYTASKHALVGLTRALANEWGGRGINVNAVAPGYIDTAVTSELRADDRRSSEILSRIPAGRWGRPADVVGPVVFLASPSADYVHGHVLAVDGGWLSR